MGTLAVGVAFASGAALMYSFDPDHGRRRRALVRNQVDHLMHVLPRSLRKATVDSERRVRGKLMHMRNAAGAHIVDDDVLVARVRSALGRCCSHPSAVEVTSRDGIVELRGPILNQEAERVIGHVRHVAGVRAIDDDLQRYDTADGVSPLQGQHTIEPRALLLLRRRWPISLRWAMGAAAAGFAASGLVRGGLLGTGRVLLGAAVALRAVANRPLAQFFGVEDGPGSEIDVTKSIAVDAPIREVFAAFVAFENFPKFMRHVREVRRVDDNRWHWTVDAAGGLSFDWDGMVTECEPPFHIGWTSVETATIHHEGAATFESIEDGRTRITIRLAYHPPLGAVGHAVARVLGADPKTELNDDLVRFKSLLETGKATGRAGSVTREEVLGGVKS